MHVDSKPTTILFDCQRRCIGSSAELWLGRGECFAKRAVVLGVLH